MIVIAYNYSDQPISIVAAKSVELAIAYWHGAGVFPHSTKTENDFDYINNGTGVIQLSSFGQNISEHLVVLKS